MQPMMKRKRFGKEEAILRLGRGVYHVIVYSDIVKGRVTEVNEIEPKGFEVIVGWGVPGPRHGSA